MNRGAHIELAIANLIDAVQATGKGAAQRRRLALATATNHLAVAQSLRHQKEAYKASKGDE